MARILLVRHAHTEVAGKVLTGRMPGIHLSATGREQARALVGRLNGYGIERIVCSPLERARETAAPMAAHLGLPVQTDAALTEIDFGDWQGHRVADLQDDPQWRRFNTLRSATPIPGGETMLQVQARMVSAMQHLQASNGAATLALFSHGDPLKSLVCHFCCIPLDCMLRFELDPASVSVVDVGDSGFVLRCLNITG